jgi:GxxExxY protein
MEDRMEKDPRTHATIGAAMEVHRVLGPGLLEALYHEALSIELGERKIPFVSEPRLVVHYKIHRLRRYYVPDFLVSDAIVVELKAQSKLTPIDEAQIINSLRISGKHVGLLINFGERSLAWKRFVHNLSDSHESA